jgi:hypothetical protein
MTLLTNSTGGPKLIDELFFTDWALSRFAGLTDPPTVPRALPPAELRPYEGRYRSWVIPPFGAPNQFVETVFELRAADGMLRARSEEMELTLGFYRDGFVLATDQDGASHRADFVRGSDGSIAWFRERGRLYAYQG